MSTAPVDIPSGWCSRRLGDDYAPDEHDGSFQHAQREGCANFTPAPVDDGR